MEVLTVAELKDLCRRRGLVATGSKEMLIETLVRAHIANATSGSSHDTPTTAARTATDDASSSEKSYDSMAVPQLKDLCRRRSLPVGGIKADIVARLKAQDAREAPPVRAKPQQVRDAAKPKKPTKRALVFQAADVVVAPDARPATPPKKRSVQKDAPEKADIHRKTSPFALSSPKSPGKVTGTMKRKISGTTGASPSPSKANKTHKRFVFQSPTTATSPKRMIQLSLAQYLTKQTPSPDKLQQYLTSHSPDKLSLSQYLTADKASTMSSVSGSKQGVFLVLTTSPTAVRVPVKAFTSLSAANTYVRQEFYERHPGGWSSDEFIRRTDAVDVKYDNERLTMSMRQPHKTWTVGAVSVPVNSTNVSMTRHCFVVSSRTSRTTKAHDSMPIVNFHRVFTTKEAANAFATSTFEDENPWKWVKEKLAEDEGVNRSVRTGMLSLSKEGSDGTVWTVRVIVVEVGDAPEAHKAAEPGDLTPKPKSAKRKASTVASPRVLSPPQSQSAAKRTVQDGSTHECFVVYSSTIFREERRGKRKEPEYEFYPPVKTQQDATTLAEAVFYRLNPWGWSRNQFQDKHIKRTSDSMHLLKMSVLNTDSWEVGVAAVRASAEVSEEEAASGIVVYSVHREENSTVDKPRDPSLKIETILPPHEVTGTRMEDLFCRYNPYGWSRRQFHDEESKISKTFEDGLFTISVKTTSNSTWVMKCAAFTQKSVSDFASEDIDSPPRAAAEIRVKAERR